MKQIIKVYYGQYSILKNKNYIEKNKRFHKYSITKFNISKEYFDIRISRYIECRTYTFYKSSGCTYDNSRDILDITHYETCWE